MHKRLVWFAFRVPKSELRAKSFKLQHTRDAGAFALIAGALGHLHHRIGPTIFNFPRSPRALPDWLRRGDLVVMTTRPPLNPDADGKKRIDISGSDLETEIFGRLRTVIAHCSRKHVEVSDAVKERLGGKRRNWMAVDFEVNAGGGVKYAKPRPTSYTTLGYLVFCPSLRNGSPKFIAMWGAGGTETYVLCYLLSTRLRSVWEKVLASRRTYVLMCEFDVALDRYSDPPDMTFASKSRLVVAGCSIH